MYIFPKAIDQVINRIFGIYKGVLSPKAPRQLVVPSFIEVDKHINSIDSLIEKNFNRINSTLTFNCPLIVADKNTWEIAGQELYSNILNRYPKSKYVIVESNNFSEVEKIFASGSNSKLYIEETSKKFASKLDSKYGIVSCGLKKHDIIYGVGGGSVIDVAKYSAYKLNLPFISIPTSLANDGFASPFSVLNLNKDGVHTLKAYVPLGVIVDLSLIKSKDEGYQRRIRSGIGDLLSNITAVLDWELAGSLGEDNRQYERLEPASKYQAFTGAESLLKHIEEKGSIFEDDKFLEQLALSLISSAESMGRYGSSRPASGFEHKLYHMYNELKNYRPKSTHGEMVAVGALISSYAHGRYYEELRSAFKKVGLPTTESELNQISIDKDDLKKSITKCWGYRNDRYTILEDKGVDFLSDCVDLVFE